MITPVKLTTSNYDEWAYAHNLDCEVEIEVRRRLNYRALYEFSEAQILGCFKFNVSIMDNYKCNILNTRLLLFVRKITYIIF